MAVVTHNLPYKEFNIDVSLDSDDTKIHFKTTGKVVSTYL